MGVETQTKDESDNLLTDGDVGDNELTGQRGIPKRKIRKVLSDLQIAEKYSPTQPGKGAQPNKIDVYSATFKH
jgi:hypothetical protein